jgi:hypothetical protein
MSEIESKIAMRNKIDDLLSQYAWINASEHIHKELGDSIEALIAADRKTLVEVLTNILNESAKELSPITNHIYRIAEKALKGEK